ncbi:MAG TPA: hypothetical protein V6D11_31340 [Waterburya sp.]
MIKAISFHPFYTDLWVTQEVSTIGLGCDRLLGVGVSPRRVSGKTLRCTPPCHFLLKVLAAIADFWVLPTADNQDIIL